MYHILEAHKDIQIQGHPCCLEVLAKWEEMSGCCAVATVFDIRAKLSGAEGAHNKREVQILTHTVAILFKRIHKQVLSLCKERDISLLLAFDGDVGSNELNYYSVPTEVKSCRTRSYCQCTGYDVVESLESLKSHTTGNLFTTYSLQVSQGGGV
ncbi:MAG: hypothetical protein V3S69_07960 [Dehalococcoidales bacterium]